MQIIFSYSKVRIKKGEAARKIEQLPLFYLSKDFALPGHAIIIRPASSVLALFGLFDHQGAAVQHLII